MADSDNSRSWWRFFDGSVSVSASMLLAVLIDSCALCDRLPLLGFLGELAEQDDGVIIVATLLLFPTTAALYGGAKVIFAAKEAVEKKAMERGRQAGRQEGLQEARREERARISKVLAEHGVSPDSELARRLTGESE